MNKSTLQLIRLVMILVGCLFLFAGGFFYQQHKQQKEKMLYARKMQKIYLLMKEHSIATQKMMANQSERRATLSIQKEEVVKTMESEMETCQVMLSELPDPPESMLKEYSALLDVHIAYKQYMNLAIGLQEVSSSFVNTEKKLKSELNTRLSDFDEMPHYQQEEKG
ncbi:hypothetical protein CEW92_09575 [Bacillaceae bacterium SAS-127]|nr:hypothetical protein CEW92_09575 [Bacillaceae bacterium SAS-127]